MGKDRAGSIPVVDLSRSEIHIGLFSYSRREVLVPFSLGTRLQSRSLSYFQAQKSISFSL